MDSLFPQASWNSWRLFAMVLTTKDIEILKFCRSYLGFLLCKQKRRMLQGSGCVLDVFPFTKKSSAEEISFWLEQQTDLRSCYAGEARPTATQPWEESLKQCGLLPRTVADGVSSPWLWAGQKHGRKACFQACNSPAAFVTWIWISKSEKLTFSPHIAMN